MIEITVDSGSALRYESSFDASDKTGSKQGLSRLRRKIDGIGDESELLGQDKIFYAIIVQDVYEARQSIYSCQLVLVIYFNANFSSVHIQLLFITQKICFFA